MFDFFKKPIFSVDGFTLTLGMVILAVVIWYLFLRKK